MTQIRNVGFLIFDGMEDLDFAGPYEVFTVTMRTQKPRPFDVYTFAETETIRTYGDLQVIPHYQISACPEPDILLIPGGQGTRVLMEKPDLLNWIKERAARVEYLLSVCTGSLVLARAGLLDGLTVTTHHSAFEELAREAPTARIEKERRYVDNGKIITSGGISAGIDMALHVVARLLDEAAAQTTADHMEYRWLP